MIVSRGRPFFLLTRAIRKKGLACETTCMSLTSSLDYLGIGFLPCMTILQSSCMLLASLSEHASYIVQC